MLAGISKPSEHDLKFLQRWFKRKDLGYMPLEGADSNIWGEWDKESGTSRYINDLIAVNRNRDELDPVTDWIAYTLVRHYVSLCLEPIFSSVLIPK
jgi:hypothetical protein